MTGKIPMKEPTKIPTKEPTIIEQLVDFLDNLDSDKKRSFKVGSEEPKRFSITLPKNLSDQLEAYRQSEKIESIAEAFRILIEKGLLIDKCLNEGRVFVVSADQDGLKDVYEVSFAKR